MRVNDNELFDFIRQFGRRKHQVTRGRLLAILKSRFYGREDARQLLYRLGHLGLITINDESIVIRYVK